MFRAILLIILGVPVAVACQDDRPLDQPRPLYGEAPVDYPIDLYDQSVEGEAVLRVRVTASGDVDSVEVEESAGHIGLDSAAVKSLLETRFTPAKRGDEFVRSWVHVPVRFSTRPRVDGPSGNP